MAELPSEILEVLDKYDARSDAFCEGELEGALRKVVGALPPDKAEAKAVAAEMAVLVLTPDYPNKSDGWGTYYGPMSVFQGKDGKWYESPGLKSIDGEVLAHWEGRARFAKHPILRGRYADAVWDLSYKATGKCPDVSNAQIAIDAYVETASRGLYEHSNQAVDKLRRALGLSLAIRDEKRTIQVRDAVLELQKALGGPDGDDFWSFSYEMLVDQKYVPIDGVQLDWILGGLEKALTGSVDDAENKQGTPLSTENTALRLAEYYRRHGRPEDVKRVMQLCVRAYIAMSKRAAPILGAAWLSKIRNMLVEFGCKEEVEAVSVVLRDLGKLSRNQMVEQSHTIEVPKKEIDDEIDRILDGNCEEATGRIVGSFIPHPDEIVELVKRIAKKAPLSSLMSVSVVDADGRETSQIGSVEDDLPGRVVRQTAMNIQVVAPFLRRVFAEWTKRFELNADKIVAQLYKSPLFEASRRGLYGRAVQAWLAGDHLVAVHLLIPQIEHLLRLLMVGAGDSGYKPNRRNGGIQLKVLDDILRDEKVVTILGEPCTKYLQVLLSDGRGWNLRNDLCHGLIQPEAIGPAASDRVFHALLILGTIRCSDSSATPPSP